MLLTVDCEWSSWGEWTLCSVTCGLGVKTSTRSISKLALYGGKDCEGNYITTESCSMDSCPGIKYFATLKQVKICCYI